MLKYVADTGTAYEVGAGASSSPPRRNDKEGGEIIRDVRDVLAETIKERCIKQTLLANKAGLTKQQLSDIIRKIRKLDANEMFALCVAMQMTPNDLFEKAQQPT